MRRRVGVSPRQRAAAWGAIALDTLGFVALVVLVVAEPIHTLGLVLLAAAFLGAFFLAVTSLGPRRVAGTVAAVGLGVGFAIAVLFWNTREEGPGVLGLATIGLFLGGTVLARIALVIPPPTGPELFNVAIDQRVAKHPVAIVNMKSGGGKAEQFDIPGACRDLGIEVVVLEPGAELTELARDAVARGADVLGMAGGDGSLAYVASVAVEHELPFVCIPAGTRNHFALDVGLDRTDPRQALSAFLNGEERRIDYATINDKMFLNNVSLGVYAAIVEQDEYRNAKIETTLQTLPELLQKGGPNFDLHFDVPDHGRLDQAALLQVSNGTYDLSSGLGRRGSLTDGVLGIITVDPQRTGDLVRLTMLAAAGWAEHAGALWSWSAPELIVESGQPTMSAGLDGETMVFDTPLRFATVARGLRILVPPGSRVGLAEQNLGAKGTYSGLLDVAFGRPTS